MTMTIFRKGILFAMLLLSPILLYAQIGMSVHHLTTNDGLSNNSVRYIYQDSKGFVWMCSLNGLNRYDGNSFVTFQPSNDTTCISLADRRVRELSEDKNKLLWITTSADLISCYDLTRGRFVDFTGCGEWKQHYSYVEIMPGEVWLWGHNLGCRRITWQDGRFISQAFDTGKGTLPTNRIFFVQRAPNGQIWIGTDKGLYRWQDNVLQVVETHDAYYRIQFFDNKPYLICADGTIAFVNQENQVIRTASRLPGVSSSEHLPGNLPINGQWLILTPEAGYVFNPHTNTLAIAPSQWNIPGGITFTDNRQNYWVHNRTGRLYYFRPHTEKPLVLEVMPSQKVGFVDMERYYVVHDSNDVLWISTYGNGMFAYNLHTDELRHFTADNSRSAIINSNSLMYIAQDRSGGLWISGEYTGISYLSSTNQGASSFYPAPIQTKYQDPDANRIRLITAINKSIFMATRDGNLYQYDASLSTLQKKTHFSKNIYAACQDSEGNLWLGSRGNGLYINEKQYMPQTDNPYAIAHDNIFCLLEDSKKRMWIGTFGGGLDLAEPDGKGGYTFRHFFNKTYGERRIRTLVEDRNGWIWVGTSEGLIVFHPDRFLANSEDYHRYNLGNHSLRSNEIRHIMQDRHGRIWIAETGIGFCVCTDTADYSHLKFKHYGIGDGLINSMVQTLTEDRQGRIWVATEYGVSCYTPETDNFKNYFFAEDMPGNIYSESSAVCLPDGRLLIGSSQGAVLINPALIKSQSNKPIVTFTDFKLNGESISPEDKDSPLQQAIAYTQAIRLRHNQNSFTLQFSTLDYAASTPRKFSYMLKKYDKIWSIPSTEYEATYKNLPPGKYLFQVKALNASGQWSDTVTMQLVIIPPFWQTAWAYMLYALLIIAALYIAFRIIHNMSVLRNKVRVEEQLTEYKLMFFTNISHEFRTPLTLIQAALEKMCAAKTKTEIDSSIKLMNKSTSRMLRLVNQLLEFRKMQNNKLALSLEETDVIAFLYEIYLSFADMAESKRMDFIFQPSIPSFRMFIDKGHVDKIVYNILSNAFKYTPSGGKICVNIQVDKTSESLIVQVSDTGVGIPEDKRSQLFSRFMQSSFSSSSMGIGLNLTHELAVVHKGSIRYEENLGGGSIFTVTLPTNPGIYQEKDFLVPGNVLLREKEEHMQRLIKNNLEEQNGKKATEQMTGTVQTPAAVPLNRRKILVIEDDTDIRELLKEELSVYFEVEIETEGKAGFEHARNADIDLIVSDVMMPGYSGLEVTQKLKSDFSTCHIPIILLTALNDPQHYLEGIESGADAYITKPFSVKLLLTRIFKLIEQRDKLRQKFSNDLSIVQPTLSANDKDKEFAEKLTRIAEEQLENPEFNAEDYASAMNMGRTLFFKKVRGVTGYSPMEYLRVLRMKKAAELLATTDNSVTDVTYKVGISDPFYFSKCFKAQFGVSPSAYQKEAKSKTQVPK